MAYMVSGDIFTTGTLIRGEQTCNIVSSVWLAGWQHGFDTATYTETDSPGSRTRSRADSADSDVYDCIVRANSRL